MDGWIKGWTDGINGWLGLDLNGLCLFVCLFGKVKQLETLRSHFKKLNLGNYYFTFVTVLNYMTTARKTQRDAAPSLTSTCTLLFFHPQPPSLCSLTPHFSLQAVWYLYTAVYFCQLRGLSHLHPLPWRRLQLHQPRAGEWHHKTCKPGWVTCPSGVNLSLLMCSRLYTFACLCRCLHIVGKSTQHHRM